MKEWIRFHRSEGKASRQAHANLPTHKGGITYEREIGREGFFGPVTQMHHTHAPTGWVKWEGELRPRAFDFSKQNKPASSPWDAHPIMHNAHLKFRIWVTSGNMDHLVANGDGDDLLFVHTGKGRLFCDFGHITFTEGDYLMLPRSTRWRVECEGEARFLLIEASNDGYRLPDKGLVGPNAIFDPAALDVPALDEAFEAQKDEKEWQVVVKRWNKLSTITFPFNPLDAVGWHGDNLPVRINWRDIRPLMSHRYHLPPSAHTTFLCNRFVVCTFVPRPSEMSEDALKLPFYHSNNDFDEIIFYHMGEFFSRDNIHPGMVTYHPCGFPHGPHPKAFKKAMELGDLTKQPPKILEEVAVMIDTRDAVEVSHEAAKLEWKEYCDSWREKEKA